MKLEIKTMKSKERFVQIMDALREQYDSDLTYSEQVGEAMGVDFHPYNNNALVNCLVQELASWFCKEDRAIREISHFMYNENFGRDIGKEPLDLWLELNLHDVKNKVERKLMFGPKVSYKTKIPTGGMHNSDPFGNHVANHEDSLDDFLKDLRNRILNNV